MSKQQNLWQRLKPEIKQQLGKARKEFPYAIGIIEEELKRKQFLIDVKWGAISFLLEHTNEGQELDYKINPYEFFTPLNKK